MFCASLMASRDGTLHAHSYNSKRPFEHPRDVDCLALSTAAREIGDLVPAARAVGDDQRVRRRGAHGRQERQLRHPHRHVVVRGVVAEASRHAATARFDQLDRKAGHEAEHRLRRRYRVEGLLVAMRVQQRAFLRQRGERQRKASGAVLTREEFLEQECVFRQAPRGVAQAHHQEFVAQRQEARRLEADDGGAALDMWQQCGDHAPRLGFCLLDQARGEIGAPAAQRPRGLAIRADRVGRLPRKSRPRATH